MRPLLICLVLTATPALAQEGTHLVPGTVCLPAAPQPAAELRRARAEDHPARLRRAMLTCLRDADGPRKRPLRRT